MGTKIPSKRSSDLVDNYDFALIGGQQSPFAGYISSLDPSLAEANVMILGSKNVYKKLSGTIAVRPGRKLRGTTSATIAPVRSSAEPIILGNTRPMRVCNGKWQVEMTTSSGVLTWADILTGLTDITQTRFVFNTWWDDNNKKDVVVGVNGSGNLYAWSGGVGELLSATANTITLVGTQSALQLGFDSSGTLLIGGVEYTYTGAGVSDNTAISNNATTSSPAISSSAWHAQKFTTNAASTQILTATALLNATTTSTNPAVFIGAIYSDNAGVPGTKLASAQFTVVGPIGSGTVPINFTFNVSVSPATPYHVVFYQLSGAAIFTLYRDNSGATGATISSDSGASWGAQNGPLYATVIENIASSETFVGVSPNPSAVAVGSVIVQKPITNQNVPATGFAADFLRVVNNQVHVGSYNSRLVYVSRNVDYRDFGIPDVRVAGDADLLTLDSAARAISVQKGTSITQSAVISGSEGDWYTVLRNNITVGTTLTEEVQVVKSESADLESALGQEFIDTVGDSIVFLDRNNQLRQYGTVRNINTPVFPTLSLDVEDELSGVDFTGGHLRAVGDIIYLVSPLIGTDYMYQTRQKIDRNGNLTAERIWHPPQIRNISRIAIIGGVTFGHSNSNPQIYQIWNTNQWHDDAPSGQALSYACHMRLAYQDGGRRQGFMRFDKVYYEGYIGEGSPLNSTIYCDYQGASQVYDLVVNSVSEPAITFSGFNAPSLGDESLGDEPLGDGVNDSQNAQQLVPKFRTIAGVTEVDCFEYSLEVWSEQADAMWEILALGTNQVISPLYPTEIMQT